MSESSLGKSGLQYFWSKLKEKFVQSDWNQNDDSQLDYVKNRPCYKYQALGDTLSWDGVTYTVSATIGNMIFAKVSDKVITATDCASGGYIKRVASDGSASIDNYSANVMDSYFQDDGFAMFDSYVVIIPTANYTMEGVTFPEAGVYFYRDSAGSIWVSELVVNGLTDLTGTYYKTISEEYLNGKLIVAGTGANAEVFNGNDPSDASGSCAHAEGKDTLASGAYSHAQNMGNHATGYASHAEGQGSKASGSTSHAEGYYTKASSDNQHAQGKWNVEDTENRYAHIVGNGTAENDRQNIHTVDWDGNAWYKGAIYVGGTGMDDAAKISAPITTTVTLAAASWTSDAETGAFVQTVAIADGTANSLIALQPTVAQIVEIQGAGCTALMINNDGGTFIATAVGAALTSDMSIQISITETASA